MALRKGKQITIYILDAGEDSSPDIRYTCKVVQEDGKETTGNVSPDASQAISCVHWYDLDN